MSYAITALCAFLFGWILAHAEVAHECRVIGGFFVGNSVFDCSPKLEGGS